MMRDQRGSISVFLAVVFLAFLLLISMCTEGIYLYVGRGKAMSACMAGLSHVRGNYQKDLEARYHIFAMDPRYVSKAEKDFMEKVKVSLEGSQDSFRYVTGSASLSQKIYLTDQGGEVLKYQIRELMKYEMPADLLSSWKDRWDQTKETGEGIGDIRRQMEQDEKEAEEKEQKEDEENETVQVQGEEDPRKGFMELLREGSVRLVMGERKVSSGKVPVRYGKKDTSKEQTWDFMKKDKMEKQLKETEKMVSGTGLTEELPAILYSTKYFRNLTSKEKKEGIQYETEYLIAGRDSEKENLGSVFWKMIGLRFLTNAACVYQDPAKREEAALIAASVLGITGIPPLVAAAKHLLLLALAYGESVIDVRNLVEGEKVPLVKTTSGWQLPFSGLAGLNCKRKPAEKGLSYEDYLGLLLIMQGDKQQKYFRMMDLIEDNIRRKDSGFRMNQCLASCQITADIKIKRLGFGGMVLPFGAYSDWKFQRTVSY